MAGKKMKRIKFEFGKFLHCRYLESLHSRFFSTVSDFLFNQSMAFAGPRKGFPTGISSP